MQVAIEMRKRIIILLLSLIQCVQDVKPWNNFFKNLKKKPWDLRPPLHSNQWAFFTRMAAHAQPHSMRSVNIITRSLVSNFWKRPILYLNMLLKIHLKGFLKETGKGKFKMRFLWKWRIRPQVANTRPMGWIPPSTLFLSGPAPCFYPAAVLSSHLTIKE